ncbi:MAG: hypothetical protein ACLQPD_15740 [Desulfomonilaceae bacterium]
MYPIGGLDLRQEVADVSSLVNSLRVLGRSLCQAMKIGEVYWRLFVLVTEGRRQAFREFDVMGLSSAA